MGPRHLVTSASRAAAWDEPGTNQPGSFSLLLKQRRRPRHNTNLPSLTGRNFSRRAPSVALIPQRQLRPLPDASEECKRKAVCPSPATHAHHAGRERALKYSLWQSAPPSRSRGADCHHLTAKMVTEPSQLALNQGQDLASDPQLSNEREQALDASHPSAFN